MIFHTAFSFYLLFPHDYYLFAHFSPMIYLFFPRTFLSRNWALINFLTANYIFNPIYMTFHTFFAFSVSFPHDYYLFAHFSPVIYLFFPGTFLSRNWALLNFLTDKPILHAVEKGLGMRKEYSFLNDHQLALGTTTTALRGVAPTPLEAQTCMRKSVSGSGATWSWLVEMISPNGSSFASTK